MRSHDELVAWLRLVLATGLGRATTRRLLAALGSPGRVLAADEAVLTALAGPDAARALNQPDPGAAARVDASLRWLDATSEASHDVVTLDDGRYPPLLLQTADPPLLLYTLGRVELLSAPSVAIVGSRSATPQGMDNARQFARFLSDRQLTIVSGLAMGIDGAAHEGALAGPGATVAFVGTGLEQAYPARHAGLMRRIASEGLVASEYPPGTPVSPQNFPRRNRLIAGISLGTLVVEAAVESGSLITARMALESDRAVFAIPGSIHSPQSRGCHRLIQEGAALVETGDDILRELRAVPGTASLSARRPSLLAIAGEPADDASVESPDGGLAAALGYDPVTVDVLAARSGLPADVLAARLLDMELAGVVQRLPGGLVQRRGRA